MSYIISFKEKTKKFILHFQVHLVFSFFLSFMMIIILTHILYFFNGQSNLPSYVPIFVSLLIIYRFDR
ncbi:hypothetical protein J3Q64DRAFT_1765191 [Phycomyces blakesleeanus]|uniref:Uncharacterized protein n=1 Tax=Phycomyces blakesleeanus TaxID=4837 RepID=A0ABR3APM5_PHYBL